MRYAEYCQQIEHLKIPIENINDVLNSRPISKWAYCVHDMDEYDEEDEKKNPEHKAGTLKPVHIHVMMKLQSDQIPETIGKWFEDEPQYIERGKSRDKLHMYENMCSYLVHETETSDGKYHYPDSSVTANFDFHMFMENVRHGVEEAKQGGRKHPLADTLIMICNNEIPRIKLDDHIKELDQIRYNKDIEQAYKIRDTRLAREVNRNMDVMYLTGPSGTGKTTWAKTIATQKGYSVFVSGSSNDPLEGYIGQECVILDDIRGSDWKINDLLKMLDNNTNSLVKSRYSNKLLNDCKLMILTSVQDIDELYGNLKEHDTEPIEQLRRRCSVVVDFTPTEMKIWSYNPENKEYESRGTIPNMTAQLYYIADHHEELVNDIKNIAQELKEQPW